MKQDLIDKLIRERIATLPEPPPRGWEALQEKLDHPAPATDGLVAAKLAALTPTPPAGSWASLEQKLDSAQAGQVDQAVAEGLLKATPVTVSGWAQLAARLELTGRRREMVACMKITEAVVLLSLLIIFFRFNATSGTQIAAGQMAEAKQTQGFPIAQAPGAEAGLAQSQASAQVLPTATATVVTSPARSRPLELVAPISSLKTEPIVVKQVAIKIGDLVTSSWASSTVTTLAPGPIDAGQFLPPALQATAFSVSQPVNYGLNFFVSPLDVNQVVTKDEQRLGVDGQSNFSTGFSSGLLVNINRGKNGFETGLVYSYRAYVPAEILLIEGRYQKTEREGEEPIRFGRLKYRTVSIPLNYERLLHQNNDWRISGGLGVAMNVILSSNFSLNENYTEEDLRRHWALYKQYSPREINAGGRSSESAELDFFKPVEGYWEGGSLVKNSSLYLSGNITVERLLNERWSVYFSPTVNRLVTFGEDSGGKGPLGDRIHNTMLRLGTRVRLTDK